MTFGQKVNKMRQERGLTQEHLGALCGLTGAQVSRYEAGVSKASGAAMINLCRVFKCKPVDLADDPEEVHGNDRNSDAAGNG